MLCNLHATQRLIPLRMAERHGTASAEKGRIKNIPLAYGEDATSRCSLSADDNLKSKQFLGRGGQTRAIHQQRAPSRGVTSFPVWEVETSAAALLCCRAQLCTATQCFQHTSGFISGTVHQLLCSSQWEHGLIFAISKESEFSVETKAPGCARCAINGAGREAFGATALSDDFCFGDLSVLEHEQ